MKSDFEILKGKRVGLVTNPTGVDRYLRSTVDILFKAPGVTLAALFGPEHGVRGEFTAGEYVTSEKDPVTGLPVYSLYGKTRKPAPEMLRDLDVIVYDVQDIGSQIIYLHQYARPCHGGGCVRTAYLLLFLTGQIRWEAYEWKAL